MCNVERERERERERLSATILTEPGDRGVAPHQRGWILLFTGVYFESKPVSLENPGSDPVTQRKRERERERERERARERERERERERSMDLICNL